MSGSHFPDIWKEKQNKNKTSNLPDYSFVKVLHVAF